MIPEEISRVEWQNNAGCQGGDSNVKFEVKEEVNPLGGKGYHERWACGKCGSQLRGPWLQFPVMDSMLTEDRDGVY